MWVAAPDVVANARATLELFATWQPRLRARGLPVALVAQDGLEAFEVPWAAIDCLFIGGSTDWKLSESARRLVAEAKLRHKLVHVGRVNTRRRIGMAFDWGADSVDGTAFSRFPDIKIPLGLRWIAERDAFHSTNRRLFN